MRLVSEVDKVLELHAGACLELGEELGSANGDDAWYLGHPRVYARVRVLEIGRDRDGHLATCELSREI